MLHSILDYGARQQVSKKLS